MENFWKEAVKVTGAVAVIGFIFALAIKSIFQESVLNLFGSERAFYISFMTIGVLAIALITSLIVKGKKTHSGDHEATTETRSVNIDKSKITGDIVLGDKTINQDRKS